MNRIQELFKQKKNNILNVYCTAGYPKLDSTVPVMKALQDSGVDMIELGIAIRWPMVR
jgi:tryptophan synthase alpha chain